MMTINGYDTPDKCDFCGAPAVYTVIPGDRPLSSVDGMTGRCALHLYDNGTASNTDAQEAYERVGDLLREQCPHGLRITCEICR